MVMVCGVVENEQTVTRIGSITIYNFMTSRQLENILNRSQLIISRSGYTTVMDLAKLGKKAFFIPTPGQFEQEYLAKKLQEDGLVPYCKQDTFDVEKLDIVNEFKGLSSFDFEINFKSLFSLFKGE
jgi:predicted glycosyltransferase